MEHTDRPADDWDFSDDDTFVLGDQDLTREGDDKPTEVSLVFTGTGDEYFRIWVINLLLMLMTLGLYSPWAKVRKAKYFRNNTHLEGHVFDYHGDPRAILRGRIIALFLFALYSWAFEFSKEVGVATMLCLCATAPWLFLRGQQFALSNTSFRGLRFGFRGDLGEAYRTVLPVVALWLAPSLAGAFVFGELTFGLIGFATFLTFPWMHHRLKSYQHRNATYGDRSFSFTPALGRFYAAYVLAMLMTGVGTAFTVWLFMIPGQTLDTGAEKWMFIAAMALVGYLIASSYLGARLQQIIWNRTRLANMQFITNIRLWPLFRLVASNTMLTLLSAGLYWPWAAVNLARYRIQCLQLLSPEPVSAIVAGTRATPVSATGDSAADAFGFDIGL